MPRYYVYNSESGEIVHQHESYDAVSGNSLPCTREEVLALVDEAIDRDTVDIVEDDVERRPGSTSEGEVLRVDPETQTLRMSRLD